MFSRKCFSRERTFIVYHQTTLPVKLFLKFIFKFHFAETLKALWLLFSQDSLIIIALAILDVKLFLNFLYLLFSLQKSLIHFSNLLLLKKCIMVHI